MYELSTHSEPVSRATAARLPSSRAGQCKHADRHRQQPRRPPHGPRHRADQFRRRNRHAIVQQESLSRGGRMLDADPDRIDKIAQIQQAAAVADRTQR